VALVYSGVVMVFWICKRGMACIQGVKRDTPGRPLAVKVNRISLCNE
jgi:hypothetical protein